MTNKGRCFKGGFVQIGTNYNKKGLYEDGVVIEAFKDKYIPVTCEYGVKLDLIFEGVSVGDTTLTYNQLVGGFPRIELGEAQGLELSFSIVNLSSSSGKIKVESFTAIGENLGAVVEESLPKNVLDGNEVVVGRVNFPTSPISSANEFTTTISTNCFDVSLDFDFNILN